MIEAAYPGRRDGDIQIVTLDKWWSFDHRLALFPSYMYGDGDDDLLTRARTIHEALYSMANDMHMRLGDTTRQYEWPDVDTCATPFNIVMTREWMLLVPRSQECVHGISINGMGFAGSIAVVDDDGFQYVRDAGLPSVLQVVAVNTCK